MRFILLTLGLTLLLTPLCTPSNAFDDAYSTYPVFKNEPVFVQEYTGKQRYSEEALRNDPEVLVSTPNKPRLSPMTEYVADYHKQTIEPEIKVSSCVEFNGECKPSEYFKATVKE